MYKVQFQHAPMSDRIALFATHTRRNTLIQVVCECKLIEVAHISWQILQCQVEFGNYYAKHLPRTQQTPKRATQQLRIHLSERPRLDI